MRLATLRQVDGSTIAARADGDAWVLLDAPDVGALLAHDDWQELAQAGGERVPIDAATLERPVLAPSKIVCVGLNYRSHILEMGRDLPSHPTLFAKFVDTLTGPEDAVAAVAEDPELDWEGELVIVVGRGGRRIPESEAHEAIAGYTIANDISMRGWQFRTKEWLQGKAWEASTPVGPVVVTPDELDRSTAMLRTSVDGVVMQEHAIADLVFSPEHLVSYVSTMVRLRPGDLILTGTPGGVGRARDPQVYLRAGQEVRVAIDGIGELRTSIVEES